KSDLARGRWPMMYLIRCALWLVAMAMVFSTATHNAQSYVRSPLDSTNGTPIHWNRVNPMTTEVEGGRIVCNLNPAGSDDLPFSQVEQAIASSFEAWEDVPTSVVKFTRGPDTTSTTTGADNQMQLFWLEDSTTTSDGLNVAGALALSRLTTIASGS